MHTLIKHLVICALFAVALLGGGELPVVQAAGAGGAHVHAHSDALFDTADYKHDAMVADAHHDHPQDHHDHGADRCCGHIHVHCCAATAILAAIATAPAFGDNVSVRIERNSALPYGQLSIPLLRPPRNTA